MTFHETAGQGGLLLLLLYAGATAGLLFDLSSLLRRALPRVLRFLPDLCWCVLTAALCFLALFLGQESALRLFMPLGLLAGGALYALGVRQLARTIRFFMTGRKKEPDGESSSYTPREG